MSVFIKRDDFYLCFRILLFVCLVNLILANPQAQASTSSRNLVLEFSDDGKLSLNAEQVPLKTILSKIQEKITLEFKIYKDHLELPISVSFQSLTLQKGIQRILHGVNYACIFDPDGKIKKIIILPETSGSEESSFHKGTLGHGPPHEKVAEITPTPKVEDLVAAIKAGDVTPPPEVEDLLKAMENVPAPEAEDLMKLIKISPAIEEEDIEETEEVLLLPELEDLVLKAMETMPSPEAENLDESSTISPPNEEEHP